MLFSDDKKKQGALLSQTKQSKQYTPFRLRLNILRAMIHHIELVSSNRPSFLYIRPYFKSIVLKFYTFVLERVVPRGCVQSHCLPLWKQTGALHPGGICEVHVWHVIRHIRLTILAQ